MSDPAQTSVEDLDVSARSMQLLLELGVETVGDLLALPSIRAPKLVIAELTTLFEELGVTYSGTWDTPEMPPVLETSGSIAECWDSIEKWLAEHAPDALESFRAPASAADITAAEKALGLELPSDYKELLARHDGQEDLGPMVAFCTLLPVAELAAQRTQLAGLMADGAFDSDQTDPGIEPVAWNPSWISIGHFQRDYLILDLAPAAGGTVGQIFSCYVDDDRRELIASSCAELLSRFFRELQDGTIDLD